MKVAIYVRVSTDKQEVENQLLQLRKYCEKEQYTVYHEYVDIISGRETSRPAFDKLFKDARKNKFNLVLFWDLSRFSRAGISFTIQKLKELDNFGINWHSYQEAYFTSLGQFKDMVLAIMSEIAKIEREKISERTKAGLERAKLIGNYPGRPKLNRKIYSKYCDVPKCRCLTRFDAMFCKKHKALEKKLQENGGTSNEQDMGMQSQKAI
jgi:DNA invertase Pin-like site-specific DNA recombinase